MAMCDKMQVYNDHYDVIVVGGGATGAGVARDCALRGLKTLLLEARDMASGASGRNHGLLHSGARYAVTDSASARECIAENRILRVIARHCVEPTGGLMVTLPQDDLAYQATFVDACHAAGIDATVIDPAEALQLEPGLNPALKGAVRVPDAAIDPFRLVAANVLDACAHGAVALNDHEVTGLEVTHGRVTGVQVADHRDRQRHTIRAEVTVVAAGCWTQRVLAMAGVQLTMLASKGTMVITSHRMGTMVLNRCRRPANGDILVPDGHVSLLGTTSLTIDQRDIDEVRATPEEVDLLIAEGAQLAPGLERARVMRAYAGVRPLVADDSDASGRTISRGIVVLDHARRDGIEGLVTITGGKLMTYRLMAERATDVVCAKLHNTTPCTTAMQPLPGSEPVDDRAPRPATVTPMAAVRYGARAGVVAASTASDRAMVCECQGVTLAELKYAVDKRQAHDLTQLMHRTRLGMGACQGRVCATRAAIIMSGLRNNPVATRTLLEQFVRNRWRGLQPVAWGDTLRDAYRTTVLYQGLCGLTSAAPHNEGGDHE